MRQKKLSFFSIIALSLVACGLEACTDDTTAIKLCPYEMPQGKKNCQCINGEWTDCKDDIQMGEACTGDMPEGKTNCRCVDGEWSDCQDICTTEMPEGKTNCRCINGEWGNCQDICTTEMPEGKTNCKCMGGEWKECADTEPVCGAMPDDKTNCKCVDGEWINCEDICTSEMPDDKTNCKCVGGEWTGCEDICTSEMPEGKTNCKCVSGEWSECADIDSECVIEFIIPDDKKPPEGKNVELFFYEDSLKVEVNAPEKACGKELTWKVSIDGPSGVKESDIVSISDNGKGTTATLTNKTLNVLGVTLTVSSDADPSVSASTTIDFKPYTEAICVLWDNSGNNVCHKPYQQFNDAWPYLPGNAYDDATAKVFNNDLLEVYLKRYLMGPDNTGRYFGTRASVVAAARFLTLQFPYFIRYRDNWVSLTDYSTDSHYVWSNDKYWLSITPTVGHDIRIYGLNLTKLAYNYVDYQQPGSKVIQANIIPWNSPIKDKTLVDSNTVVSGTGRGTTNGLACSGFVTWSLRNGRLLIGDWWTSIFGNYGDCKVQDKITGEWKYVRNYYCEDFVNGTKDSISGDYKINECQIPTYPASRASSKYNKLDEAYKKLSQLKTTNTAFVKILSTKDSNGECNIKLQKCTTDNDCIDNYDCNEDFGDTCDDAAEGKTDFINVKCLNEQTILDKIKKREIIKAGDLLWQGRYKCDYTKNYAGTGGHIAMIVGIDRKNDGSIEYLYVAEATVETTKGETYGGTIVSRYEIKDLMSSKWSSKDKRDSFIIRMDNIYSQSKFEDASGEHNGNDYGYSDEFERFHYDKNNKDAVYVRIEQPES